MRARPETILLRTFLRKQKFSTPIHFNEARKDGYRSVKVSTYGRTLDIDQLIKLRKLFEKNGYEIKRLKNTDKRAVICGTMYFAGPRIIVKKKV